MKTLTVSLLAAFSIFFLSCETEEDQYRKSLRQVVCGFMEAPGLRVHYSSTCRAEFDPSLPTDESGNYIEIDTYFSRGWEDTPFDPYPYVSTDRWEFSKDPYVHILKDLNDLRPDTKVVDDLDRKRHIHLEIAIENWANEAQSLTDVLKNVSDGLNKILDKKIPDGRRYKDFSCLDLYNFKNEFYEYEEALSPYVSKCADFEVNEEKKLDAAFYSISCYLRENQNTGYECPKPY